VKISFVGCGAAGRVLARLWLRAGHEIGTIRSRTHATEAVAAIGAGVAGGSLEDAEIVVFGAPDDALADLAAATRLRADQVAIHLSGVHPSTVLAPTGARTAGLHPLCAFASIDVDMSGKWCFVEGEAVDVAEQLALDLGARVEKIDTEGKRVYHAAAAIASNYLVTLFDWAVRSMQTVGVEGDQGSAALLALMEGTLQNVREKGVPLALTGPIARGDVAVVRTHLEALPEAEKPLYKALLKATIPIGRAKGTLSEAAARELEVLAG
jgi:predicted short-subunit dehydrogenase-like oxidoreductase (DUF2520 family)